MVQCSTNGGFIYYLAVSSTVVEQTVVLLWFNSTESRKMVQCSTNGGFIYYLAVSSTVVEQTVVLLWFNSTESRIMVQCYQMLDVVSSTPMWVQVQIGSSSSWVFFLPIVQFLWVLEPNITQA
jgi:hypothetical protein